MPYLMKVKGLAKALSCNPTPTTSSLFLSAWGKSELVCRSFSSSYYRSYAAAAAAAGWKGNGGGRVAGGPYAPKTDVPDEDEEIPTSGISRPLSEILKQLNKKVPDSLVRVRTESDGFSIKYIPWLARC